MATHSSMLAWRIPWRTTVHGVAKSLRLPFPFISPAFFPFVLQETVSNVLSQEILSIHPLRQPSPPEASQPLCKPLLKKKNINNFLCLCIHVFIFGCAGSALLCRLSLVAASRGYSLLVCRLLIAVTSLVEDGLQGVQARQLWPHPTGVSCPVAFEIFLVHRSNLCLLHGQADSLPLSHQGNRANLSLSAKVSFMI